MARRARVSAATSVRAVALPSLSSRSRRSFASWRCLGSAFSAASVGSVLSAASAFSGGSILSIGSAGSILSIGSTGSILSIGSVGAVLGVGARGKAGPAQQAGAVLAVAALLGALKPAHR